MNDGTSNSSSTSSPSRRSSSSSGPVVVVVVAEVDHPPLRDPGPLAVEAVEPGGHHRDPHLVTEGVVDDRAEDDVGVGVGGLGDELAGLVDLVEREVGRAGDAEQDAAGALDAGLQQRAGDGGPGGVDAPALAGGEADAHERRAGVGHDHLHVGEVGVDEARRGDQVGDPLDALEQDLVGGLEGAGQRGLVVDDLEQPVVGDDDEGVDLLLQLADAVLGLHRPLPALEGERPGHDADRRARRGSCRSRR